MAVALAGDAEAYRELLDDCRALLERYLARFLERMGRSGSGHLDDLVQEALVAMHEKRHTYDPSQPFLPWLFALARYKAIDFGRRQRVRSIEMGTPQPEDFGVTSSDGSATLDVSRLLETLPPRQRRAIELVKIEGLSVEEAAEALGSTDGALKVTVHRALARLKRHASGGSQ